MLHHIATLLVIEYNKTRNALNIAMENVVQNIPHSEHMQRNVHFSNFIIRFGN